MKLWSMNTLLMEWSGVLVPRRESDVFNSMSSDINLKLERKVEGYWFEMMDEVQNTEKCFKQKLGEI